MFAELDRLQQTLRTYINATYHLSHPSLVALRDELLSRPGALQQRPFIESTPRYQSSGTYRELGDDMLPPVVRELFSELADAGVLYQRPYTHQAQALQATLVDGQDLVITTGTGSGKSESFMLPVLGRLAVEAEAHPDRFQRRAVRALLLYPMNALVNDQLGRIRGLFGSPEVTSWFTERTGRPAKFGRYTGKTLYPGHRREGAKHGARLHQLKFYVGLEESAQQGDAEARKLISALQKLGKWPAKPPSGPDAYDGMTRWFGKPGQRWSGRTYEDLARDPELLIRHEIQAHPPDLLITNYSMLEYMLLRPIERDIFRETAAFFRAHPNERFFLILDESHLYRGSTGAEIGMLVRRLRGRLGLRAEQLAVISTSASFSNEKRAAAFIAGLSGKSPSAFRVLTGDKALHEPAGVGSRELAERLAQIDVSHMRGLDATDRFMALSPLLEDATLLARPILVKGTPGTTVEIVGIDEGRGQHIEQVALVDGEASTATALLVLTRARLIEPCPEEAEASLGFVGEPALARLDRGGLHFLPGKDPLCRVLWDALAEEPVSGRLINKTSGTGQDLKKLPGLLFPEIEPGLAEEATWVLLELCPAARSRDDDRPLLAARVHVFLRGLPGLWACSNPGCTELPEELRDEGPTGQLFAEPVRRCGCGARVFELHSCRSCGSAFFSVWADDPDYPTYLWQEEIGKIEDAGQVQPLTIALQPPEEGRDDRYAVLEYTTGRLYIDHPRKAETIRDVWIPELGSGWRSKTEAQPGWFPSCPCCGAGGVRYPVQDHTTSGDDPFMEVTREQLLLQAPQPESSTPLKGRKVLVFSDGRQMASRLSGKLQQSALRDSARPLLLDGMRRMRAAYGAPIPLAWAYLSVLVGCICNGVDPRPKQASFIVEDLRRVRGRLFVEDASGALVLAPGRLDEARKLWDLFSGDSNKQNSALMSVLLPVINDPYTGLAALGLADVEPILDDIERAQLAALTPPTGGMWAGLSADKAREALVQLWLQLMMGRRTLYLPTAPAEWVGTGLGPKIDRNNGSLRTSLQKLLPRGFHKKLFTQSKTGARRPWLKFLYESLGTSPNKDGFLLRPDKITLRLDGNSWARCERCTAVQPMTAGVMRPKCLKWWGGRGVCGGPLVEIDPADADSSEGAHIFRARKGHYRLPYERLLSNNEAPHPFSSAPHTAALNASGQGKAMGLAEMYELRFQDIPVPDEDAEGQAMPPIDVLSVTTTMEVGIDIGSLTAVALRNVPPGRANYQQRAGRAGRRGSALSLVVTWCGADSHDQQFFSSPEAMVSGPVPDPKLSIHNHFIVRRHLFAAVLSRFQLERVPDPEPGEGNANVFESLGPLRAFRDGGPDDFSYEGLRLWTAQQEAALLDELEPLLPTQLAEDPQERIDYLRDVLSQLLTELARAGAAPQPDGEAPEDEDEDPEANTLESIEAAIEATQAQLKQLSAMPGMELAIQSLRGTILQYQQDRDDLLEEIGQGGDELEEGESDEVDASVSTDPDQNADERKLLDRLFAQGILPRYAFPTSVVALHVFDRERSSAREAVIEHAPQRDLNQALSSYAPGREVWINGERHYSFAIWSPFKRDRQLAWQRRKLYLSCDVCGFAELRSRKEIGRGETDNCKACGAPGKLGPAIYWIRPPGFAHPYKLGRALPSGKSPAPTRPTRARLHASFSREPDSDIGGVSVWTSTEQLIVTNIGAKERGRHGFRYCVYCGLAEPNTHNPAVFSAVHERPSPDHRKNEDTCRHKPTIVALGNEFRTDVAVLRFEADEGISLQPSTAAYDVVLKTLSVALAKAAVSKLDIEPSDIAGEYRVALTEGGQEGREVEIFLYDMAAGGAGFVRDAVGRKINADGSSEEGGEAGLEDLLERTLKVLQECPNKKCTSSCYQCLRSYKNKWDHADLDRHLARAFLESCMYSRQPVVPPEVERLLLKALAVELRDAEEQHEVELREGSIWLPQLGRSVVVSHPLRPDMPATALGAAAPNPVCISQLIIERNLPLARRLAIHGREKTGEEVKVPARFQSVEGGLPFYTLSAFGRGEAPLAHVRPPSWLGNIDDPGRYLLALVDSSMLDRVAKRKEILLIRRPQSPAPKATWRSLVVLRRPEKSFAFTGEPWAIGALQPKIGGSKLDIFYRASADNSINETAAEKSGSTYTGSEIVGEVRRIISEDGGVRDAPSGKGS